MIILIVGVISNQTITVKMTIDTQVDNLLWDSEEGEGRQFRRGFFIVSSARSSDSHDLPLYIHIFLKKDNLSTVQCRHFSPFFLLYFLEDSLGIILLDR